MTAGSGKPMMSERNGLSAFSENKGLTLLERVRRALAPRYDVQREIGYGGASHVFVAQDAHENRRIAIKVLRPELAAASSEGRFLREIEIVRRLEHRNILPLYDFGTADGLLFFTMPFVEGQTLRLKIRKERQLAVNETLEMARQIAGALDYAHGLGVIHRDIKPGNILLEKDRTLVADFGIARAMIVASGDQITPDSGIVIGTVEYMSPEQGEGHRELDARSDVYAMACVVYEMLAGEPPFTGATAQAVVARHRNEAPRSIRLIRPSVPAGVERAIEKALAKVPADRFESAGAFADALDEGLESRTDVFGLTRFSRRARVLVATALLGIISAATWYVIANRSPVLDRNRIVVFPLHDPAERVTGDGEAVATLIGYALDGTRPLKWKDGWDLLDSAQRTSRSRLEEKQGHRLARAARAGFFIDGSIMRQPDSVTVILRLHDVAGDSVIRVVGKSTDARSQTLPMIGLQAISALLPDLVAPGGRIDIRALSERSPVAVAHFLQGEREYRRMRFTSALQHYESALQTDSAFVLSALRGAYAATWESDFAAATRLTNAALSRRGDLPPAQTLLARGLLSYLTGSADTAVHYVRSALRSDSTVHPAWTILGEVYQRLLPFEPAADSLARDALGRARSLDSDFAPTLLLLEEIALRDGDATRINMLQRELRTAGADTTHFNSRELMRRCVLNGPSDIDWQTATRRDEAAVLSSARILSGRAAQAECAIAGYRAILETAGTRQNSRWGAFLGLQYILAAVNRLELAADVFSWPGVADLPQKPVYVLMASQGIGFEQQAAAVADSVASSYATTSPLMLWTLALWETKRGNVPHVAAIEAELERKAQLSGQSRDRLLASAVKARHAVLRGDTATAIRLLRSMAPSAQRQAMTWDPFASLGAERFLLASLLRATSQFDEAIRVASLLDATDPVIYLLYRRASLELRAQCADALKQEKLADGYRSTLSKLAARAN